jgi:hypothetical protein
LRDWGEAATSPESFAGWQAGRGPPIVPVCDCLARRFHLRLPLLSGWLLALHAPSPISNVDLATDGTDKPQINVTSLQPLLPFLRDLWAASPIWARPAYRALEIGGLSTRKFQGSLDR